MFYSIGVSGGLFFFINIVLERKVVCCGGGCSVGHKSHGD
jgi:hypothetical protein